MEDKKEQLKGLILELFPNLKEEAKSEAEQLKETISALKAENAENKAKIDAFLNAPAKGVKLQNPEDKSTSDYIYKGFDLRLQGKDSALNLSPTWSLVDDSRKQAMAKYIIDKMANPVTKSTMVEGTDEVGGYLVFDEMMREILNLGRLTSVALQDCRITPMISDVQKFPAEDGAVSVAFETETADLNDGIPSDLLTQVTLTAKRLGAYALLGNQLLADTTFDVLSWLMTLFAEKIGQTLDYNVFRGTDLDGIIGYTGTVDSTGVLDVEHLSDAISLLDSPKSIGAKFYFHRIVVGQKLRVLQDDAGQYIFPPSMPDPIRFWNVPFTYVEQMPYSLTNLATVGVYGNLKHYLLGRRKGIGSFFVNPYTYDISEQTRISLATRWAGRPAYGKAFVELKY